MSFFKKNKSEEANNDKDLKDDVKKEVKEPKAVSTNRKPPAVLSEGLKKVMSEIEVPAQYRAREGLYTMIFAASTLVLSIVLMEVIPLKEYVPYVIEQNSKTGEVRVSDKVGKSFKVENTHLMYVASEVLDALFVIDEQSRFRLKNVVDRYLVGASKAEVAKFLKIDKGLERYYADPTTRRKMEFDGSIQISRTSKGTGVMIAFVKTSEYVPESKKVKKARYKVKMDYAIVPPKTMEDAKVNPSGIYITNIQIERLQ